MKGGLSPALLDREESKGETPLDFKRGVTAREILTEMCERPLHTHGLPQTLRYTVTPPSPLLTCSSMIKGKCTHTSLYLLPLPLSVSFHFYPSLLHISYSFSLSLSLYCTQAQHGSGCNHRWTQFQGQFKDYLLSSVNKSTDRLTLWMFI